MKKLNKILAASSLALMASVGANAADTGNVTITATVPPIFDVLVTPATNTFTLTGGADYVGQVASANATGNADFKLQLQSVNSQVLTNGADTIPYAVGAGTITGGCVSFAACPAVDLTLGAFVDVGNGSTFIAEDFNVFVEILALDFAGVPADDYSDTLNFAVVAQ